MVSTYRDLNCSGASPNDLPGIKKGRFCKMVVLANVPSFQFLVPSFRFCTLVPVFGTIIPVFVPSFRVFCGTGEHRQNHPFGNHPFANPPTKQFQTGGFHVFVLFCAFLSFCGTFPVLSRIFPIFLFPLSRPIKFIKKHLRGATQSGPFLKKWETRRFGSAPVTFSQTSEKPRIRLGCPSRSTFSQAPRKLLLVVFGRKEYG